MRILLVLGCIGVIFFFTFGEFFTKIPFPKSVGNANTGAKVVPKSEKVRVVLFTGTSWNSISKTLHRRVIATPAWREFIEKEIQFTSHEIPANISESTDWVQGLMEEYEIHTFPTLVILNDDFKKIDEKIGAGAHVENYKAWIRAHKK